ncbi:glucose-6-phosphate 1-dehydrogenase [Companilactobacillus sp. RD055328]|uniref:glucose-6-phosphate dehydrogenase n=1 Tax=Companilactobacillus sp. RD055328 TaxID=2916634 RepID=UPI001FC87D9C|nr:glucose-6-phosphate dehydrogenase [Companilactobacillus sp. RD055328]GKQ42105.1 glucose-6-phosphate 1-dehydrogenase [Companilactobacillus sp. RD055328]
MAQQKPALFIIFGGSGDLAHRKLYPALFNLYRNEYLDKHFAVIGTARRDWTDDFFRNTVKESLKKFCEDDKIVDEFVSHFYYQSHDVNDSKHYITLKKLAEQLNDKYELEDNRIYYMSIAPALFGTVAGHIKSESLITANGFNRLVIEKPFGRDYETAQKLNDELSLTFDEDQIYRIDHYLGKEMVQNIPTLRFSNPILETVWNKDYISNVQITLAESLGVEERGGYYDGAGALRDMVQNHVMQIIAQLTMKKPTVFNSENVHAAKHDLFASLKVLTSNEVDDNFVRGQYGTNQNQSEISYREGLNIAKDSQTETYVAGKIMFEKGDFTGVPFYVRTGKRLSDKSTRIDIVFKKNETNIFLDSNDDIKENVFSIIIEPDQGYRLLMNGNKIGMESGHNTFELDHGHTKQQLEKVPEAYERLIVSVLNGDQTNFTRFDELANAWKYIDVIRERWDNQEADFPNYRSGSMGPSKADELLAKDGNEWIWKG